MKVAQHRRHDSSFSSFGSFGSDFDLSDVSGYFEANEFFLDNTFTPACEDLMAIQNIPQFPQPLRGRLGSGSSLKLGNISENKEIVSAISRTTTRDIPRIPPSSFGNRSSSPRGLSVDKTKEGKMKNDFQSPSTNSILPQSCVNTYNLDSERDGFDGFDDSSGSINSAKSASVSVKKYKINNAMFSQNYSSNKINNDDVTFKVGEMFCKNFEESMRFDLNRCNSLDSFSDFEE